MNLIKDMPVMKTSSDVAHTELDSGVAVLLDLQTRKYFTLNASGSFIWKLLETGTEPSEIAPKLALKYSLDIDKASHDVEVLCKELVQAGLLIEAS